MTYCTPADVGISDNRQDHLNRGSAEPGTDYKTAYGTDLRAPGSGRVIGVDHSPNGPEGRRLTFLMDNGEVIDWIHLASISASPGQRIEWGQTGLARSGASGWGRDWYYGPHLHVTRRARVGLPYSQTLNFEDALGGAPAPAATPEPTPEKKALTTMAYIAHVKPSDNNPAGRFLVTEQGNGRATAVALGGGATVSGFPEVNITEFQTQFWQTVELH